MKIKQEQSLVGREEKWIWEELYGGEYDQKMLYETSKELIKY